MGHSSKRLRLPSRLRVVVLGGFGTLACSSSVSTPPPVDGGKTESSTASDGSHADGSKIPDASSPVDGGPCKLTVPAGKVCETLCHDISTSPPTPYACQIYCAPPDEAGPGRCTCNGGFYPEMGLCPGAQDCELQVVADGGTEVNC